MNNKKDMTTDQLTGLPDLASFRKYMNELLEEGAFRSSQAIVFFDIENFKLYNSKYGIEGGDALLCYVSEVISEVFSGDFVSRTGEDHFAVYTKAEDLPQRIRLIHDKIRDYTSSLVMLMKAGIYPLSAADRYPMLMLDNARIACEHCKEHVDSIYAYYDPHLSESMLTNKYIVDHLDEAIRNGSIRIYYQPLMRILSGQMCGMEALCRWEDPNYGLLSPGAFITVLEKAHMIHRLDLHVAEMVCRDLRETLANGETVVPVSINLSRLDFDLCDVFTTIDEMVVKYDLEPWMLDIEITESALSEADEALRNTLTKFRNRGYRLWMDDFGSVYSSLNILKNYDFDVLKIDMTFLSDFDSANAHKSKTIVSSVINMAKQLGITTLCEGVETESQLRFLRDAGCEIAQGYLFSRPMPLEELKKKGLERESKEDHRYSQIVGQINLMSADPLQAYNESGMDAGFLPMGLFEYSSHETKVLVLNSAFENLIRNLQIRDVKHLYELLNIRTGIVAGRIQRAAVRTIETNNPESVDLVVNGDYLNLQLYAIATNSETGCSTVLASATDISRNSNFRSEGIREKLMKSIYSLFDRVDVFDLDNGTYTTLHETRGRYREQYAGMNLKDIILDLAEKNIHPDDRERFLELYDLDRLVIKLKKSSHAYNSEFFRVSDLNGSYYWKMMTQVLTKLDGRTIILSVAHGGTGITPKVGEMLYGKASGEAGQISSADAMINTEKTFDALINAFPYGIFWKDKNRRFRGANKFFLDFYDFLSADEIIGRNDEDMGWHVDPNPFKNDEIDVLNGKMVYKAQGTCISHGREHRILASKFPVYSNDEIIGLIGFFIDQGIRVPEESTEEEPVDELTGLLNEKGAVLALERFERTFYEKKIDFALLSIDINDFSGFNQKYGTVIADEVLKRIARILTSSLGIDSVIARIGGDEFVVLHQIVHEKEMSHIEFDIASAVSSIHAVNGVPCSISVSVETMIYSKSDHAKIRLKMQKF